VVARSLQLTLSDIRNVIRAATPTHAHLRDRLVAVAVISLGVDLVASILIYLFEHHAKGTDIHGWGDALFFTTAQLLTVSSSMVNPLTAGGRVLDLILELYAITVVATLAGSFAAFFQRRGHERDPALPAAQGQAGQ